ncbi:benzoate 4-monooxygenase cytochrome p450 [Colletotrichum sojae]|uniref:Benzoate 4-monooxygenase cytochrome p450 n=1 Tax=Colletotrichum sojae TaxID=2175907 RepID=A0A8H6MHR0_9PEZI|nr:benzoate 4-monooxygenase cytochrome p450 [Colletotrichum sojae]
MSTIDVSSHTAAFVQAWDWKRLSVSVVLVPALSIAVWWVVSYLASPLRKFPGPPLAGKTGSYHIKIKELREKYGPVVRIGPNTLDLDLPGLIKTLYGPDGKWKTPTTPDRVLPQQQHHNQWQDHLSPVQHHRPGRACAHEAAHRQVPLAEQRRGHRALFNSVISEFCEHLENRFMSGSAPTECDFSEWIGFYSWDANGAASFSQRFGYMDKGHGYDGTIAIADKALDYFAAVGQMPSLDFLLDKNPVKRIGPPNLANITRISLEHLVARLQGKDPSYNPNELDFLQHFIESKETHPELVNNGVIMGYLLVNLLAGADTTAITIRAIFWYALHSPRVYEKLEEEILAVNGRNKSIWGEDVDTFRPERWLQSAGESDEAYKERLRLYNASDLTFGGGSRLCIGRNVALLETYKIVPTLIRKFEIALVDADRKWEVTGSWFPRQKGFNCYLKKRD